jgi:hypothetical protein
MFPDAGRVLPYEVKVLTLHGFGQFLLHSVQVGFHLFGYLALDAWP